MKRILSLLLAVLMICAMLSVTALAANGGGEFNTLKIGRGFGTEEKPYVIKDLNQLKALANEVNKGSYDFNGVYFALGFSPAHALITPIGTAEHPFRGNFDGRGNIVWLDIDLPETDYVGLFGYCVGSEIKNVYWQGSVVGHSYVGGICGYNEGGSITGCGYKSWSNIDGSVTGSGSIDGLSSYIGGLCGHMADGEISDCSMVGTVANNGTELNTQAYLGGLCGFMAGNMENCINSAEVIGTIDKKYNGLYQYAKSNEVGGLCGHFEGKMRDCINKGEVVGNTFVGGITGLAANSADVRNCCNEGRIIATSAGGGGLCGSAFPTEYITENRFINCFNAGTVCSPRSGGLFGVVSNMFVINCINIGQNVGSDYASITYSAVEINLENSYYDKSIFEKSIVEYDEADYFDDRGRTTEQMKSAEMLASLNACADKYSDFGLLHWVRGEDGYPRLDYPETESTASGSVLSEGSLWIVIAVAVLAIGGVAALMIVKKKPAPAIVGNKDDE